MKRRVKVDLDQLSAAFELNFPESHYYLDLETGRVVMTDDEINWKLEELYDEIYDEEGNRVISLEDLLRQRDDLQDWFKEMLLEADQVEQGYGTRYISVDPGEPHGDYRDMERFITTVEDPRLREQLWDAIQRRGAFRRFKDLLACHPEVEKRWFAFKSDRIHRRMLDWLEFHDIEPIT
jgi:hypothetical protein